MRILISLLFAAILLIASGLLGPTEKHLNRAPKLGDILRQADRIAKGDR